MSRAWIVVWLIVGCSKSEPVQQARTTAEAMPQLSEREAVEKAAQEARKGAAEAIAAARAAQSSVGYLEAEAEALREKLAIAVSAVATSESEQALAIARQDLAKLQKQQFEQAQRLAAAKTAAAKAERHLDAKLSKECQDNPLAAGCM